jgi:hypothetical protein
MDAAAAEFEGLIRSTRATLSESEASEVLEFFEARDYALALETLCGFLLDANRRVTPELFVRIHSIGRQLENVDPYLIEQVRAVVVDD